jgi:sugar phosphate isomerase/epimerase
MGDDWKIKARELKSIADDLGVKFVQMHSYALFEPGEQDDRYDLGLKYTIRSIELCKELGIPYTVVHGADRKDIVTLEQKYELNRKWYSKLFPVMEETGVEVLGENSRIRVNDNFVRFYTGKHCYDLAEYINHPLFHICWDTGHANFQGSQYQHIVDLGKHLRALHYNDNNALSDQHTAPFLGNLNNDEIMSALIKIGYKGYFNFECDGFIRKANMRRPFEGECRLIKTPIEVMRQAEKLLYLIGKSILSAYDLFEE